MSLIHSDTSIAVVAVGPGDSSLMTLQGREILENADVVAGFKTVLDVVRPWIVNADARDMTYRNQEEVLEYVESQALLGKKCVVCAWGDLNFSARELVARVRRRAGKVELTPGISSVQVACVRAGIAMEDSLFITLHQRRGASERGRAAEPRASSQRRTHLQSRTPSAPSLHLYIVCPISSTTHRTSRTTGSGKNI